LRSAKNIEYLPFGARADWSQGFLELHIHRQTGEFHCIPHFINGRALFNGEVFAA